MATVLDVEDSSRARVAMWMLALALGAVLAYVIYSYLGTFVLGLFVYYITRPIHRRIADRIPTSSLAAAVSLVVLALPLLVLIGYTAVVALTELAALVGSNSAQLEQLIGPYIEGTGGSESQGVLAAALSDPQAFADQLTGSGASGPLQRVAAVASGLLSALGNGLIHLFIVLALAFYLLRDDHRLAGWFREQIIGEGTPVDTYFSTVDRDLKTVFFGNILNAFAVAILAAISYNALNLFAPDGASVPSATLIGLLVGVGSLVPVVGMKIVYVPVTLIVAAPIALNEPRLLWFPAAFLGVSLLIVDTIPDFLLRPYVSGRDMHTGAVMIAYIVGPLLFGWYGLFLGPLLLVVIVHFARIVLPELVHGEPLTGGASTEGPLDPTRKEEAEPEPEPVDIESDADAEADTGGSDEDADASSSEGTIATADAAVGRPATERGSSADRVRSAWDESSTTDGGTPKRGEGSH